MWSKEDKNSSGDEIANVNFYAVHPKATQVNLYLDDSSVLYEAWNKDEFVHGRRPINSGGWSSLVIQSDEALSGEISGEIVKWDRDLTVTVSKIDKVNSAVPVMAHIRDYSCWCVLHFSFVI